MRKYHRYSAAVLRSPRWKAIRKQALDRDDWQCVQCGTSAGLECDHILSVRKQPELAFTLSNLQILCRSCHAAKTSVEVGISKPLSPARQKWKSLIKFHMKSTQRKKEI